MRRTRGLGVLIRWLVATAAALAFIAVTSTVRAEDAPKLVIVVEGGGGEKLAAAIAASLPEPWMRADAAAFAKASKTRKVGGAKALDGAKTKRGFVDRLLAATDDVRGSAVMVVRVPAAKKNRTAKVALFAAGRKAPAAETSVTLGAANPQKDAQAVSAAIDTELAAIVPAPGAPGVTAEANGPPAATGTTPPAGAQTAPEATSSTGASAASGASAAGTRTASEAATAPLNEGAAAAAPVMLDASIGIDFSSRHFAYNDAVTSNLRPYDVDLVPTPAVKLQFYPLAKSNAGVLRDVGLTGGFHAALGLDSKAPDGTKIATTWSRIDLGVRARMRFGDRAAVGFNVGYGRETFAFRGEGLRIQKELPTVGYELLRVGVDGRVPLGPVALFGGVYYLPVLHSGDVGKRIRGQTVAGIEAEIGVGVPFARRFEARVGVDYRRFFYSFEPIAGDAFVAGGALDQLLRGQLALAFVY